MHKLFSFMKVDDENNYVGIEFTPTIPHCSMATLIGLSIRVKLLRSLPPRFKVRGLPKARFKTLTNKYLTMETRYQRYKMNAQTLSCPTNLCPLHYNVSDNFSCKPILIEMWLKWSQYFIQFLHYLTISQIMMILMHCFRLMFLLLQGLMLLKLQVLFLILSTSLKTF